MPDEPCRRIGSCIREMGANIKTLAHDIYPGGLGYWANFSDEMDISKQGENLVGEIHIVSSDCAAMAINGCERRRTKRVKHSS